MISRFWSAVALSVFLLLASCAITKGATYGVTVPAQNTLSNRFLPYATSGTQLGGNSPAWRDSATVLGLPTFLEGYEALTPAANITLNWLTGRTKAIPLNQNTTFAFSNTPSGSTNIQTMVVQVVGDGTSSVSFTGVSWQTAQLAVPDASNITLYFFRARSSGLQGYVGLGNSPGTAYWNLVAGVLFPSPAADEVSIVSPAVTTGSNILLNLDTDTPWVDGETLGRVASGGVVQFRVDAVSGYTGAGTQVFLDNGKFGPIGSASQSIFSGYYGGGLPTDVPLTSAALAFDLDAPNTMYQWDGTAWY